MNDQNYAKGVGFVASVLSEGIETLPKYEIIPPESEPLPSQQPKENTQLMVEQSFQERKTAQGVKRTCGHSHKSVRMDHKK